MKYQIISDKFKLFEFNGIFLGLTFAHIITALYWVKDSVWENYSLQNHKIYCYPIFKNCYTLTFENLEIAKYFFLAYLILSVFTFIGLLISQRQFLKVIFLTLFIIKIAVLFSRYNFMGNYHTMHLSLILVALFSQSSYFIYTVTVCLQYFFAGFLKLNIEWLSGAALVNHHPYLFKDDFHHLSLAYVPILEIILIWGLLASHRFLRQLTLLQLVLFHLYSILVVGLFYPLIMLGILFPLFLSNFGSIKFNFIYPPTRFAKAASCVIIAVIIFWNTKNKFTNIDVAKDGQARYLTLNMLDAKIQCRNTLLEVEENLDIVSFDMPALTQAARTKCDPLVFETLLRRLCQKNPTKVFMFYLESKRSTEDYYTKIRNYTDVCKQI